MERDPASAIGLDVLDPAGRSGIPADPRSSQVKATGRDIAKGVAHDEHSLDRRDLRRGGRQAIRLSRNAMNTQEGTPIP